MHTTIDIIWLLLCSGMVFLMQAGFLCLEAGLTRTKNAINVALKNITDFGISSLIYWAGGFALMFGESYAGLVGSSYFFPSHFSSWEWSFFVFQLVFCATATTIISGAVAERMYFGSYLIVAVITSCFIYPVFGHWAWGGVIGGGKGWLYAAGYRDFAGSSVVHALGGWVALGVLLVIGPRKGRFSSQGKKVDIAASNLPLAMLGVLILWFGWLGFNGGAEFALKKNIPLIIINTILAGSAGMIGALCAGWIRYGYSNVKLIMNGALAGLVAITASSNAVSPLDSLIIGVVGGIVMMLFELLLEWLRIDDAVGAVSVHGAAGVWGVIAVAFFAAPDILNTGLTRLGQLKIQALGAAVSFIFAFGVSYLFFSLINLLFPLRVKPEEEEKGLNLSEHHI